MPTITSSTTLTLPAGQSLVFEAGAAAGTAVADPGGRNATYALGGVRADIGPFQTAVSVAVTLTSGTLYYQVDTDGQSGNRIVVSTEDPVDADGRPDGTIWLKVAA